MADFLLRCLTLKTESLINATSDQGITLNRFDVKLIKRTNLLFVFSFSYILIMEDIVSNMLQEAPSVTQKSIQAAVNAEQDQSIESTALIR